MPPSGTLVTASAEETRAWGKKLGESLKPGDVVALTGPLGAGKTTLTKGLAEGLECPDPDAVCSPTFAILQEVEGRHPICHVDAYRLPEGEDAPDDIGLEEYLDAGWVVVVEWADRLAQFLPETAIWVDLAHEGPNERRIVWSRGTSEGVQVEELEP